MRRRLSYLLPAALLIAAAGCSRGSGTTPAERAALLYAEAAATAPRSPAQAEPALTEALRLFASSGNDLRAAEIAAFLSTLQQSTGKLSPALASLRTALSFYSAAGDREREVQSKIGIGRLLSQTGAMTDAVDVLEDAALAADLYGFHRLGALASAELGAVHGAKESWRLSAERYGRASAAMLRENDLAGAAASNAGTLRALLALDDRASAERIAAQTEDIIAVNSSSLAPSSAYVLLADAFLDHGRWEEANDCFRKAAAWDRWGADSLRERCAAAAGAGEALFRNGAFAEAQKRFLAAYTLARPMNDLPVLAWLLVRIADCDVRRTGGRLPQEAAIRSTQFYEQAQNLYHRARFPLGEAVVMHRLAAQREYAGDVNAALTLYRRSFDRFISAPLVPDRDHRVFHTAALTGNAPAMEEWFSERLLTLLLERRSVSDAWNVAERAAAAALRRLVLTAPLTFRDRSKDSLWQQWTGALRAMEQSALELRAVPPGAGSEYASEVNAAGEWSRSKAAALARILAQQFPELRFVSDAAVVEQTVPRDAAVLRYVWTETALWLLVRRTGESDAAMRLTADRFELRRRMDLFVSLPSDDPRRERLSAELYGILIAPAERYGRQRFLIVPPSGGGDFPFHALTKEGRPLVDLIEVSYLPSAAFASLRRPVRPAVPAVSVFGFSNDTRWGLEFELREVRGFFRNATVVINQTATEPALRSMTGDHLLLASRFGPAEDGTPAFDGASTGVSAAAIPVTAAASLHPFPSVQLLDAQRQRNGITSLHPLLFMMNGAGTVIVNRRPVTPRTSKLFSAAFHAAFAADNDRYTAYRNAVRALYRSGDASMTPEAYFYYGW
ncbi:MAG: hypothetical protein F9K22_12975 [Bacteroidetes bacterium]|nr:MAG: hypothetical protein F9K22_12975 [Bacteroidota bacterium]